MYRLNIFPPKGMCPNLEHMLFPNLEHMPFTSSVTCATLFHSTLFSLSGPVERRSLHRLDSSGLLGLFELVLSSRVYELG